MNTIKLSAIALSSALIFGCGSSDDGSTESSSNKTGTFTNLLVDGYWEFGSASPVSADDLPNVYVLDGNNITYYYDDDDLGNYTAYPVSFYDDSAGSFTFDYYDNTITPTETTVYYSIADGVLTIVTDLDELVDYQDYAGDAEVIAAIASAGSANNDDQEETPIVSETNSDGFEDYSAGELISVASDDWLTEKIVDDETGTTTAEVTASQASEGEQSLYLEDASNDAKPYAYHALPGGEQAAGSVSIDVYIDANNSERSFIQVGTGPWDSNRYFQLRLKTALEYEAGDSDVELASLSMGTWHNVEMSWTEEGLFTISLDGEVVGEDIDQANTGLTSSNIPTHLVVYTGSGSSTGNKAYFDNVVFDFPEAEVETSDDFESYLLGSDVSTPWDIYRTYDNSTVTIVADDAGGGSQAMQLYDGDGEDASLDYIGNKPYAALSFADSAFTGSVSFYFKALSGNNDPCYAAISSGISESDRMMEMKITASGNITYTTQGDGVQVSSVSLGAWNKFEIIWNEGTFTLKVNDTAVVTDVTQEVTGFDETYPSLIRFTAGVFRGEGTSCRVDNVYSDLF